ncbi:hypothetical protein CIPAW_04G180800 [Carya illinoinensis]|uniref:Uncharacterized protein n=1 Tax=Carya illinoinensis TaxID=32201 RepID=A0A8T1QXP1_CARIL|nr:hypothetical protein CIPAW_04G180800 [Carya illinoinensis]
MALRRAVDRSSKPSHIIPTQGWISFALCSTNSNTWILLFLLGCTEFSGRTLFQVSSSLSVKLIWDTFSRSDLGHCLYSPIAPSIRRAEETTGLLSQATGAIKKFSKSWRLHGGFL